jgi:pyruvate/2-oxoacid:ferredoxin oxidoreductase beta subunit
LRRLRARTPIRQAHTHSLRSHGDCQCDGLAPPSMVAARRPAPTRSTTRAADPHWANSCYEDNAEFGFGMGCQHAARNRA